MKHQLGFLLFSIFFLDGCATVVRLPSSTRLTPVVSDRLGGGHVGGDLSSSVPVTVVNNSSTTPPTRNEIRVGEVDSTASFLLPMFSFFSSSGIDFGVGLGGPFELYYTNNPGLKLNMFGDSKAGWVTTVFAGYFSENSSGEDSGANSKITKSGFEYGFSVGNRFDGSKMFYLTAGSRGGKADITIVQSSGTKYAYNDTFDHWIATFGFTFGFTWYGKFEVSYDQVTWRGRSDNLNKDIVGNSSRGGFTAGFGYQW